MYKLNVFRKRKERKKKAERTEPSERSCDVSSDCAKEGSGIITSVKHIVSANLETSSSYTNHHGQQVPRASRSPLTLACTAVSGEMDSRVINNAISRARACVNARFDNADALAYILYTLMRVIACIC